MHNFQFLASSCFARSFSLTVLLFVTLFIYFLFTLLQLVLEQNVGISITVLRTVVSITIQNFD